MKKVILLVLAISLILSVAFAQNNKDNLVITTNYVTFYKGKQAITKRKILNSVFTFNADYTSFNHKLPSRTTRYYITKYEIVKDNIVWIACTSDKGKKFNLYIDYNNNVIGLSNNAEMVAAIYSIKSIY